MIAKEFYQFFLEHEDLPDSELADKVVVRFEFANVTYIQALDLIISTRDARKCSENLVERGFKNENL